MAENGRILHHLCNNIENPANIILFVGYCAENTLGRKLRDGQKRVFILGDEFRVNAQIETLDSFSGHADHDERSPGTTASPARSTAPSSSTASPTKPPP